MVFLAKKGLFWAKMGFRDAVYPGFGGIYPGFGGIYPGFGAVYPGFDAVYPEFATVYPGFGAVYPGFGAGYPGFGGTQECGFWPVHEGSLTVKVLPTPGWLETSMLPPWASTMALQIARPRPLRPWMRERDLSAR